MFSFFCGKEDDVMPSRPGEYIHKLDKREEQIPIFKYRQPSVPIQSTSPIQSVEEIKDPIPQHARGKPYEAESKKRRNTK